MLQKLCYIHLFYNATAKLRRNRHPYIIRRWTQKGSLHPRDSWGSPTRGQMRLVSVAYVENLSWLALLGKTNCSVNDVLTRVFTGLNVSLKVH